jgi:transposase-like protein
VFRWTRRYLGILSKLEAKVATQIQPGDRWHADETVVKVGGKRAYIWNVLDSQSRYLLASIVSFERDAKTADRVLKFAANQFGRYPKEIVSDNLKSYLRPIAQMNKSGGVIHVTGNTFQDKVNNNRIERFHRTLKTRTNAIENFGDLDSANQFVQGFRAYYNMLRPNIGLNGLTPIQKAIQTKPLKRN